MQQTIEGYVADVFLERAVRLKDIRDQLIQDESPSLYSKCQRATHNFIGLMSTAHAKAHGNVHKKHPTNVTTFLAKDKDVGPHKDNRPDILFQVFSTGRNKTKPTGYVKYRGRIILDSYDHGLRDFSELPKALSTELSGADIEYYRRQNATISDYDLIARMPDHHWTGNYGEKFHNKVMRVGTINQRAQRFRGEAACITWGNREGTAKKNKYILSLIPNWCKDPAVNSTKGWEDLSKVEQVEVVSQNKGTMLSRTRNAKDTKKDNKRNSKKTSKAEEKSSAEEDNDEETAEEDYDKEDSGEEDHCEEENDGWNFDEVAAAYEEQAEEEAALESSHSENSYNGSIMWPAGPHSSNSRSKEDLGYPITGKTVLGKTFAGKTVPRQSYSVKTVPGESFAGKTVAKTSYGSNTYGKRPLTQDAEDSADDLDGPQLKRPHVGNISEVTRDLHGTGPQLRTTRRSKSSQTRSTKSIKAPQATSRTTFNSSLDPALRTPLPISNPSEAGGVVNQTPSGSVEAVPQQADPPIMNSKCRRDAPEDSNEPKQENPSKRIKANEAPPPLQAVPRSTQSVHTAMDRRNATIRQHKRAKNATTPRSINSPAYSIFGYVSPAAENLDPQLDPDFQAEAQKGIERGDFRYISPATEVEEEAISQAFELTRVNFHNLKGSMPPQDLNDYKDESYASQFRRLQQLHTKKWMGELPALPLYSLPAWYRRFDKWKTACPKGRSLNDQVRQAKKSHAALMKEIDAEES